MSENVILVVALVLALVVTWTNYASEGDEVIVYANYEVW